MLLGSLLALAGGCAEETVIVAGRIGAGPGPDAAPLADAEVSIVDLDTRERIVVGAANDEGEFQLLVPAGLDVVALVRSPSTVTTAFPGVTGFIDVTFDDGSLYGLDPQTVAAWRTDFEGCPGADGRTALIGRMEFTNLESEKDGGRPIAGGGRAELFRADESFQACYLDPDEEVYDPAADRTGSTGRFAIFDLPRGISTLDVRFEWAPEAFDSAAPVPIWVPDTDEEVVVPFLPFRLEFPIGR